MQSTAQGEITPLRRIREERGISLKSLAEMSGVSRTHLWRIENRKTNRTEKVSFKLAKALRVGPEVLWDRNRRPGTKDLGNQYRLPVFGEIVVGQLRKTKIPPLGLRDVAPKLWRKTRYVLKVFDNSMEPELKKGDLVLIDNSIKPKPNNIVACSVGEKKFLRRYIPQGVVILLVAENPAYKTIALTSRRDFKIHGGAVGLIHRRLR